MTVLPVSLIKAEEEVIILDDETLPWISEQEPPKSIHNLLRIKFKEMQRNLSEEDENAIASMLKIMDDDQKIKLKSYAYRQESSQKSRELAIQRALRIRKSLILNGFNVQNASFFIYANDGQKFKQDYIDIDKY